MRMVSSPTNLSWTGCAASKLRRQHYESLNLSSSEDLIWLKQKKSKIWNFENNNSCQTALKLVNIKTTWGALARTGSLMKWPNFWKNYTTTEQKMTTLEPNDQSKMAKIIVWNKIREKVRFWIVFWTMTEVTWEIGIEKKNQCSHNQPMYLNSFSILPKTSECSAQVEIISYKLGGFESTFG